MTESVALGVLGLEVPRGTHICTFYGGSSGRDEIVLPFLAEGIRARDKCLCFVDSAMSSEVLSKLALQVDVGPPVETGQLEVGTPADSYLRSGRFSADEMIDYWGKEAAATRRGGDFSLTRATGEMPLALNEPGERAEFLRYEARLNEVIPGYPQVILCLYDLERFGADVLMDALRTHPMVIVDGMVHDNPYYIEPGKFFVGPGVAPVPRGAAGGDDALREQLSALTGLLVLSNLLTRQEDEAGILHLVASAVESLGHCRTERIRLDGRWTEVRVPQHEPSGGDLDDNMPPDGVRFDLAGVPWSWAYSMSSPRGPSGCLVVGAEQEPAEGERFLLQVLAQQAGVALANARLHSREREQAEQLRVTNLALQRTMEIHDRLTRVALEGQGQEGIAQAVYELTGHPAAIEDRFGNLLAWAGPGRPSSYPKDTPSHRDSLLRRAMAAAGPIRDGKCLFSVAPLGQAVVGVLVLHDPDGTAEEAERVTIEHAATVLAMEFARLQTLAEAGAHLRSDLVVELVEGVEGAQALSHALTLGYDLGRPHRVVVVEGCHGDDQADDFFHAVRRAAREARIGSLVAARLGEVVILADTEAPGAKFRAALAAEWHHADCRIGVGGRRGRIDEFPHSYREAQLALKIQQAVGGRERLTLFDDLGVYQVLATVQDPAALECFVREWLGALMDYDATHGAQLVMTLSEYLECGGNYDATARVLSVHRSTLKYRLRRIREVSGYDLGLPDTQFNLQLAARAWRTMQVLRGT